MMLPSLSFKIRPEDAVAISIKNVCRVFLVDLRGNSCIATRCVSRSASAVARGFMHQKMLFICARGGGASVRGIFFQEQLPFLHLLVCYTLSTTHIKHTA